MKGRTWLDLMRYFYPTIDEQLANYILWNETAFPFSDIKMTVYQIRQSIRTCINKISICECCGMKDPFHKYYCHMKAEPPK